MEDMVNNFDLCSIEENSFGDFVKEQLFFYQGKNLNMRNFTHTFGTPKLSQLLEDLVLKYGSEDQKFVAKKIYEPMLYFTVEFLFESRLLPKKIMTILEGKSFVPVDYDARVADLIFLLKTLAQDKAYVKSLLYDIENELYNCDNPRLKIKKPTDAKCIQLPIFDARNFHQGQIKTKNSKRDNGGIPSDMLKPPKKVVSKTCTNTIIQLLEKLDDIVETTIFIGNRPFALSSNRINFEVIDGPMLYVVFSRHVTKSIAMKLAEKIKNSSLCTALNLSPEKPVNPTGAENGASVGAVAGAEDGAGDADDVGVGASAGGGLGTRDGAGAAEERKDQPISPTTRTIISALTDSPHFERLRSNLRDEPNSKQVVKNLKIAFDATLQIANNNLEEKHTCNEKRKADKM